MKKYIAILGIFVVAIVSLMLFDQLKHKGPAEPIVTEQPSIPERAAHLSTEVTTEEVIVHEVVETKSEQPVVEVYSTMKMDAILYEADWTVRTELGMTEDNINRVMLQMQGLYAYDVMNSDLHQLYAEIYLALTKQSDSVALCSLSEEDIDYAYNCVITDHPEIFYTQGYVYTRHISNEQLQKITFGGNYTHDTSEIAMLQAQTEEAVKRILAGAPVNADEYTKVKYIYDYIILNTEYVLDSKENQNICSVLLYGSSVCQGYAKTMQLLLNRMGVKCTFVTGNVDGEGHSWNLVNINNAYYYVDVTWGDASYVSELQEGAIVTVSYEYYCITSDELFRTHTESNAVPLPRCVATEANYYVKEGLMFYGFDDGLMQNVFSNAYACQKESVMIKCSDKTVFDQMQTELIENQKIFNYLKESTQALSYSEDSIMYTYTFLLTP